MDEIITELWRAKDRIAAEYDGDVDAYVDYLRKKMEQGNRPVVDLSSKKSKAKEGLDSDE